MRLYVENITNSIFVICVLLLFSNSVMSKVNKALIENPGKVKDTILTQNKFDFNCERETYFDGNHLCFPEIYNWVECRLDNHLKNDIDNLELNNKILAYYVPDYVYRKMKVEKVSNFPVISLFVQQNTIGMKMINESLPVVIDGLKKTFTLRNWEYVKDLLRTKTNDEFLKPILFDNYSISNNARTCVTINSITSKAKINRRVSFINVLNVKNRIMFLNYSREIDEDFEYTRMKYENDKVVTSVLGSN